MVISFQEHGNDIFGPVRDRLRVNKGRIRKMGADYLAYCLLDMVVDSYFTILEQQGNRIEQVDEELLGEASPETLATINSLKREITILRRSVWPLREVINNLEKRESSLIQKSTNIYLRDVYDHTIQVIETVETSRDILSGMVDMYLSTVSNAMNQVMKVLTIIATIFIPLTFIAGIYGMNFANMPELGWRWGYPASLVAMAVVAIAMVVYFRKKRWL
jgi:magnesium transporter